MNNAYNWYSTLIRPTWAPPSWLFGPVWSVLYTIIAVSFGTVFYKIFKKELPSKLAWPFVANVIFNGVFSPIQFGLKNNLLASLDILLVLLTLVWFMTAIWKYKNMRWVALVNIPYLVWVSFATILQITITILNL